MTLWITQVTLKYLYPIWISGVIIAGMPEVNKASPHDVAGDT